MPDDSQKPMEDKEKKATAAINLGDSANNSAVENQTKAAIWIYSNPEGKPTVNIQEQIQACKRFIDEKHWILSDTFIEEKESDSVFRLIRQRAMSRAFDYVVYFVNCTPANCPNRLTGVIVCCPTELYFKEYPTKGR